MSNPASRRQVSVRLLIRLSNTLALECSEHKAHADGVQIGVKCALFEGVVNLFRRGVVLSCIFVLQTSRMQLEGTHSWLAVGKGRHHRWPLSAAMSAL